MPDYFMAVQAQNLRTAIFDTEDLSTIRGGSYLRIETVRKVERVLQNPAPAAIGVASGIWQITAADDAAARDVVEQVKQHLAEGDAAFLTFGVACVKADAYPDFRTCKRALTAALRRGRLAAANDAYPKAAGAVCPIDLVRPVGAGEIWFAGAERKVSASVYARRGYGVAQKQGMIMNLLGERPLPAPFAGLDDGGARAPFAILLSSVSEGAEATVPLKRNLRDKIAVIHLDGNSFGSLQDAAIGSDDLETGLQKQKDFDADIAAYRKALVAAIVNRLAEGGAKGSPSKDEADLRAQMGEPDPENSHVIRFEALMWGGDELTFIVPARLGWAVAQTIVERLEANFWRVADRAMTAAIGMVFCHHDAPIARIRALTDRLATHLKHTRSDWKGVARPGRARNLVFPLVLESFDHIGENLDDYLDKRVVKDLRHPTEEAMRERRNGFFALAPDELATLQSLASAWNKDSNTSRGRLRALAQAAHTGRLYRPKEPLLAHLVSKTLGDPPTREDQKALAALLAELADPPDYARAWMLLEDVWDYLVPTDAEPGAGS